LHQFAALSIVAVLAAVFCSTSAMNALLLPSALLPILFVVACVLSVAGFRKLEVAEKKPRLTLLEWGLLAYALLVGVVRLVPYTAQYFDHSLAGAVNFDDNWHFQELASLVNTERFPPRLNFHPESFLHFYYLPWIPAAALSIALKFATGQAFIKFSYGVDALFLGLAATFTFILFVRHVLEPGARKLPIIAALVAGAGVDGVFAILRLSEGRLDDGEWWETAFHINNQFSSWTTLLVWVPHHLISAMALLLALVVATEPRTLAPRRSLAAQAAAGLLLGFSLFSSIFAFLGGALALAPLLLRYRQNLKGLAVLCLTLAVPSIPLLYIYAHANSSHGFLWFKAFSNWTEKYDFSGAGYVGLAVALALMCLEVGWLFVTSVRMDRAALTRSPLGPLAAASALFLVTTAFISFKGSNNFAMRGAIAPVAILCCYWAQISARKMFSAEAGGGAFLTTRAPQAAFVCVAIVACVAQANEFALHLVSSWRAISYVSESQSCKNVISAINSGAVPSIDAAKLADCRNKGSVYSLERMFEKPALSPEDEELVGRGP
jgi:hypothetical protein